MALDPNNARAGVARHLLGAGPMPLPAPQNLVNVLAQLHRAHDGGAFEHPWNANLPLQTLAKSRSCATCHAPHSYRQV
jgi:hypothetical protein